ncbi:hypothetical protein [Mesomycoplasma lagogenitalium]|uniref:Uncharacterized protein n=1 Tax=Mesomycoplasma lagogenitalium TaxID=171286 RepID=A0ABY8LW42_9BACT|nr:hypothetical protein [Mesomycoplasma lagogenitalium]WGI36461.1 hypothetical protein QEG99_03280 [Mesomycoplasma lagogenitalium]
MIWFFKKLTTIKKFNKKDSRSERYWNYRAIDELSLLIWRVKEIDRLAKKIRKLNSRKFKSNSKIKGLEVQLRDLEDKANQQFEKLTTTKLSNSSFEWTRLDY